MNFLDAFEANEQRFFQFNKVYVIENLFPPHTGTGWELYVDVLSKYEFKHRWLRSEHLPVTTRKELFAVLSSIENDAKGGAIFPFVHIEAHGCESGLELENNGAYTIIPWEELAPPLRRINIATKNNLMLSVASCFGSGIHKTIRLSDRAPFFGFIAPLGKVEMWEIQEGYNEFFARIIDTVDENHGFDNAVLALRGDPPRFTYMHCETLFRVTADNMVAELRDPIRYQHELRKITERSMNNAVLRRKYTILEIFARCVRELNKRADTLTEWFEHFTMKDLQEPDKS